jgi:hypothetical protein
MEGDGGGGRSVIKGDTTMTTICSHAATMLPLVLMPPQLDKEASQSFHCSHQPKKPSSSVMEGW